MWACGRDSRLYREGCNDPTADLHIPSTSESRQLCRATTTTIDVFRFSVASAYTPLHIN
jgi:hypothetical protein